MFHFCGTMSGIWFLCRLRGFVCRHEGGPIEGLLNPRATIMEGFSGGFRWDRNWVWLLLNLKMGLEPTKCSEFTCTTYRSWFRLHTVPDKPRTFPRERLADQPQKWTFNFKSQKIRNVMKGMQKQLSDFFSIFSFNKIFHLSF